MSGTARAGEPAGAATLSGAVYATLRRDILRGALPPAAKLRIDALCRRYDATSTPVREALNQLSSEGLVLRREQRGFFVATASRAELAELTDTRCWVEPIALREAIAHRSVAWEEAAVLAMHRLGRAERSATPGRFTPNAEWDAVHRAFHHALIAACPSRWLVEFCLRLGDHAARYRNLAMSVAYPERDVAGEHRALLEAVLGGEAALAAARLEEHYRRTARIVETADPSALAGPDGTAPRRGGGTA